MIVKDPDYFLLYLIIKTDIRLKLTRYKGLVSIRLDNSIYNAMKIIRTPFMLTEKCGGS